MTWKEFEYQTWHELHKTFDYNKYEENIQKLIKSLCGNLNSAKDLAIANFKRPPWHPNVEYNEDGNQLEIYLSDEPYYGQWIFPGIVLHLSLETEEVVGVTIEGITNVIKKTERRTDTPS